jgi:hypothetical protein
MIGIDLRSIGITIVVAGTPSLRFVTSHQLKLWYENARFV